MMRQDQFTEQAQPVLSRSQKIVRGKSHSQWEVPRVLLALLEKVQKCLSEQEVSFTLSKEARTALVEEGYDPEYGARPLNRTVGQRIKNELARQLLQGENSEHVRVENIDGSHVIQSGIPAS